MVSPPNKQEGNESQESSSAVHCKGTKTMNRFIEWLIGGSSVTLAVVYTIGHMLIAIVCVMVITGASIELATLDAIVEPIINGVWFYVLHTTWKRFQTK